MTLPRIPILLTVLAGLALSSGGCRRKTSPTPAAAPSADPSASARLLKAPPSMPVAGPPGWAYVRAKDLVGIDPNGNISSIDGGRRFVHELRRASDGVVYAFFSDDSPGGKLGLLSSGTLRVVATLPDCSPGISSGFDARADHLALMCNRDGIMERRGSSDWTKVPVPVESFEQSIWIGKDGTLFYVTRDTVYRRRDSVWTKLEGAAFDGIFPTFFETDAGVYVKIGSDLLRASDGKLELVRDKLGDRDVGAASNGLFAYWSRKDGRTSLQTLAGEVKSFTTKTSLARAMLDDTGRAWSVVDGQLEVVRPDGTTAIRLPMGSYPELDRLSILSSVGVVGSGPAVPAPKPVRRTKRLEGRITFKGNPLAGAALELCPRSEWMYTGSTPCSGADESVVLKATTDAKGSFRFDDVAMGLYYVHHKAVAAEKWSVDSTPLELHEGKVSNVGTLAYTK